MNLSEQTTSISFICPGNDVNCGFSEMFLEFVLNNAEQISCFSKEKRLLD